MTDRHTGYVVTLDGNIREDDAAGTIAAIQQIKGVLNVTPVVANVESEIVRLRVIREFENSLWDAFNKIRRGES